MLKRSSLCIISKVIDCVCNVGEYKKNAWSAVTSYNFGIPVLMATFLHHLFVKNGINIQLAIDLQS